MCSEQACHMTKYQNKYIPLAPPLSHHQLTIHGIDASGKGCQRLMLKYAGDGEYQMMKALVEAGCDPKTSRDKKGRTALHLACKQGLEYIVTYLTMEMHCDPNDRDTSGESALDKACRWGHLSIVHFLVS